jgi:opacity protein-like surface antigen
MKHVQHLSLLALATASLPAFAAEAAAEPRNPWGIEPPAYVSESSLGAKVSFDSNVFATDYNLSDANPIASRSDSVYTVSPKLTLNVAKLLELPKDGVVQALSLGYAGDYAFYSRFSTEDHGRHSLPFSLKLKQGDWAFNVDNTLLYIQGDKHSPLYNTYSAYGTATVRERRNQVQNRFAFSLTHNFGSFFARAAGNALTYDLLTDLHNGAAQPAYKGYQNWVDRSDMNTGLDLGYRLNKDFAFTTGWRLGTQQQDRLPWGGNTSSSTYNRLQFGFEGTLTPWLKGSVVAGPDFRRYSDQGASGIKGASHTWLFVEGSLTATITPQDSLTVSTKVWHWVSSTSVASYQDASTSLTLKHSFNKQWSVSGGLKAGSSRYDTPTLRNDQLWTLPVGLSYAWTKNILLNADYQFIQARNRTPGVLGREYTQSLFSIGVKISL